MASLINSILGKFQEALQDVISQSKAHSEKLGSPPLYMLVSEHVPSDHESFNTGKSIRTWKVGHEEIVEHDRAGFIPERKIDGMYFDVGIGDFSILKEKGILRLAWIVGPRFARGFDFKILDNDELSSPILKWVS